MRNLFVHSVVCVGFLAVSHTADCSSFDLPSVNFKAGHPQKDELLESALADKFDVENLRRSANILKTHEVIGFEIVGHTDKHECSEIGCHDLALRRAILVFHFLLDYGINPRRLISLKERASESPISGKDEDSLFNQRAEINIAVVP